MLLPFARSSGEYPCYDRTFAKSHTEIDCDPAVWSRVEELIRQQISPATVKAETIKPQRPWGRGTWNQRVWSPKGLEARDNEAPETVKQDW